MTLDASASLGQLRSIYKPAALAIASAASQSGRCRKTDMQLWKKLSDIICHNRKPQVQVSWKSTDITVTCSTIKKVPFYAKFEKKVLPSLTSFARSSLRKHTVLEISMNVMYSKYCTYLYLYNQDSSDIQQANKLKCLTQNDLFASLFSSSQTEIMGFSSLVHVYMGQFCSFQVVLRQYFMSCCKVEPNLCIHILVSAKYVWPVKYFI